MQWPRTGEEAGASRFLNTEHTGFQGGTQDFGSNSEGNGGDSDLRVLAVFGVAVFEVECGMPK